MEKAKISTVKILQEGEKLLQGAPSFLWIVLTAGALLAIQTYVPEEFQHWGILATVAVLMFAKWIGVSREELSTVTKIIGIDSLPDLPDASAQAAPLVNTADKFQQNSRRLRKFLLG
jgi:hypothetical protein